jgi:hypothetical protein
MVNVRRADQIALFESGLEAISKMTSLINKVIEIHGDGAVDMFELP